MYLNCFCPFVLSPPVLKSWIRAWWQLLPISRVRYSIHRGEFTIIIKVINIMTAVQPLRIIKTSTWHHPKFGTHVPRFIFLSNRAPGQNVTDQHPHSLGNNTGAVPDGVAGRRSVWKWFPATKILPRNIKILLL